MVKIIILLLATLSVCRSNPVSEIAGIHQLTEGLFDDNNNEKPDPELCKGKQDGTMIGDDHDPTKFHECSAQLAYQLHCPKGLIFNEGKSACDYDPNSPSNKHTRSSTSSNSSTFNCNGKRNGFYPDENDCSSFHECLDGQAFDFHCPPHTMFDCEILACCLEINHDHSKHQQQQQEKDETTTMESKVTKRNADHDDDNEHHQQDDEHHHKRSVHDDEQDDEQHNEHKRNTHDDDHEQKDDQHQNDEHSHKRSVHDDDDDATDKKHDDEHNSHKKRRSVHHLEELEEIAEEKHLDIHHMVETTTHEFDLVD